MRSFSLRLASLCLISFPLLPHRSTAQCSDAGVCSIGGAEPSRNLLVFSGSVSYGASKDDDLGFTDIHLGLRASPTEEIGISLSIPYRSISGPLGSSSGIGDLLLAGRYLLYSADIAITLEAGMRLATGDVNAGGLPQAYQPGLGTTDGLFGISVSGGRWNVSAGYQYAPGRSDNAVTQLRRGDDVSLRGGYLLMDEDLTITGEAIIIHKIRESDGNYLRTSTGAFTYVPGGSGIPKTDRTQINLVAELSYPLDRSIRITVRGAAALLARPVNVDGLKRNFSIQTGLAVPVL